MAATPKSSRTQPARVFENYILTKNISSRAGLCKLHESLFTKCSPAAFGNDPGGSATSAGYTNPIDIGFDFQIDGIVYKKFVVSQCGWIVLVDPTTGTFTIGDIDNTSFQPDRNANIRTSFSTKLVLLSVWHGALYTLPKDAQGAGNLGVVSVITSQIDRINRGLEYNELIDEELSGTKYYRDNRSKKGRRLIVRWATTSGAYGGEVSSVIKFEVVLYENGTIEYRYAPRNSILSRPTLNFESATIGIFMPNGTNRFRDFSYGLGYRDKERKEYKYGGAVYQSTYTDTETIFIETANYTCNLQPSSYWPGQFNAGCIMTFSPPKNRRKILPRIKIKSDDNKISYPTVLRIENRINTNRMFDDRRSLAYVSGVAVNYPTTLQRFFLGTQENTTTYQDLFSGDFELTSSVSKGAVDQFMVDEYDDVDEYVRFNDNLCDDISSFTDNESSIENYGLSLKQSTRSKTLINFSLPIHNTTKLSESASLVYYYNSKSKSWRVPKNATYNVTVFDTPPSPFDTGPYIADINWDLSSDSQNGRIIEDAHAFGPVGNLICSGSYGYGVTIPPPYVQTDPSVGAKYTTNNVRAALEKRYEKTITTYNAYDATDEELFSVPINQPFLLEKAIIEIPFAAGNGWFRDKTSCISTMEATDNVSGFHFGGPALTFAIFNQLNNSLAIAKRRDLILSGTITHSFDNVNNVVFSNFLPLSATYQIRPEGMLAFGGRPSCVIAPISSSTVGYNFTGSARLQCEAQVTNGVLAKLELSMTSSNVLHNRTGVLGVFNSNQLNLTTGLIGNFTQSCYIAYITNFGRSSSGFEPSGRTIFGKELSTIQKDTYSNPFYTSSLPSQFTNAIESGSKFKFETVVPITKTTSAPYLLMPGDKLIFAISKPRPVFLGSIFPAPHSSGSIQHDAHLITGSVNIKFIGSLLRENMEFHDTLNQTLSSDAIHEVIGAEPVLDQFEVAYTDTYFGGIFDDYVTGSMVTKVSSNGITQLVTGNYVIQNDIFVTNDIRGRAFSKLQANFAQPDSTGGHIALQNPSLAKRKQPWRDLVGNLRVSQFTDNSERYWDSCMPSINQCFNAEGAGIYTLTTPPAHEAGAIPRISLGPKVEQGIANGINAKYWSFAYPFEPRYANIPRQQYIEKSFITDRNYDNVLTVSPITPVQSNGFIISAAGATNISIPAKKQIGGIPSSGFVDVLTCDADLSSYGSIAPGFYAANSPNKDDLSRTLFGFGDLNNMMFYTGSAGIYRIGLNHHVDHYGFMEVDGAPETEGWYGLKPIIRGWKYGVYSGLPAYSKLYYRQQRYGQFRDMLEQRPYTKFFHVSEKDSDASQIYTGELTGPVYIRFVDSGGNLTNSEKTWSQNLSNEATSSVPYIDGETRNRQAIDINSLNSSIYTI